MNLNRITKFSVIALIAVVVIAGTAYTQTTRTFDVLVTNICSQQSVHVSEVILTLGGSSSSRSANVTMPPSSQLTATYIVNSSASSIPDPDLVEIRGTFNNEEYSALFRGIVLGQAQTNTSVAGGCLRVLVTEQGQDDDDGGTPTPQPIDPNNKSIDGSESRDQVLNELSASGFQITQDGSESNPKLSNANDPILLRGIDGFSAQVVWVSAAGLLRTVITWDNPAVDLDLLVFGFGACFQLNPAGLLAELCDRAPTGPVPGAVFAVIVINWTSTPQQYTMSLST